LHVISVNLMQSVRYNNFIIRNNEQEICDRSLAGFGYDGVSLCCPKSL